MKTLEEFKKNLKLFNSCIRGTYEIINHQELGWCINVTGDIIVRNTSFTVIPVRILTVTGKVIIDSNPNLNSLFNTPMFIHGNLYLTNNPHIINLKSAPQKVYGVSVVFNNGSYFTTDEIKSKIKGSGIVVNKKFD